MGGRARLLAAALLTPHRATYFQKRTTDGRLHALLLPPIVGPRGPASAA